MHLCEITGALRLNEIKSIYTKEWKHKERTTRNYEWSGMRPDTFAIYTYVISLHMM